MSLQHLLGLADGLSAALSTRWTETRIHRVDSSALSSRRIAADLGLGQLDNGVFSPVDPGSAASVPDGKLVCRECHESCCVFLRLQDGCDRVTPPPKKKELPKKALTMPGGFKPGDPEKKDLGRKKKKDNRPKGKSGKNAKNKKDNDDSDDEFDFEQWIAEMIAFEQSPEGRAMCALLTLLAAFV